MNLSRTKVSKYHWDMDDIFPLTMLVCMRPSSCGAPNGRSDERVFVVGGRPLTASASNGRGILT